jgi:uncharacterized protein (TIRG00374 family)
VSDSTDLEAEGEDAALGSVRGSRLKDWRVWFGVAITIVCVYFAARGIPIGEVIEAMRGANFVALFILSAPFYVLSVYIRALRWRHLTDPIAPMPRRALFDAAALGFMFNNLLPLRIGEVVRSWTLARNTNTSFGAIVGTVVLERVLDVVAVLLLAFTALSFVGRNSDVGGILEQGSMFLIPLAIAPLVGLVLLRVAPDRVVRIARFCLRPFSDRIGEWAEHALRSFASGLGALSGGSHVFWIVLHSLTIWLIASTGPILIGLWAFDVDLGGPLETLFASWVLLGAVGAAVALPSAPGFIGPYQLAFKAVLVRFGVEPATALAMGVLVWFVFWLTLTLQGLWVMRRSRTSFAELARTSE